MYSKKKKKERSRSVPIILRGSNPRAYLAARSVQTWRHQWPPLFGDSSSQKQA